MNHSRIFTLITIVVTAMLSACTVSKTPAPPLQGPSELGLGLTITASPDVLSMDGASQSLVTIEARDSNGQTMPNVQLRPEILANGEFVDFGSLSARTMVTGANGRAFVTYTAPLGVAGGGIPTLSIRVTPSSNNAANQVGRYVDIRLVQPGIITGAGPNPSFTVTPASPAAFTDAFFDASASTASLGASIVSYSWNFADGSTATGRTATHRFGSAGTFHVFLTVTDSNNVSTSLSKDVSVGTGSAATANFTFSPAAPVVNQQINFNGGLSTAGAGHSIVRWVWDFGSGATQSGVTVSKTYDTAGTYNVVLTVTDEAGQTAQTTKGVTVTTAAGGGSSAPTATFTFGPPNPSVGETVSFNATASTAGSGHSIVSYVWTWGDGTAPGSGVTPTHVFTTAATFAVQVRVTDDAGQSTTSAPTGVVVGAPQAPTANFTFSPNPPGRNDQVVFDGSSSVQAGAGQPIVDVAWNFGDGTAVIHCGTSGPVPPATIADCPNPDIRISAHTFTTNQNFVVNLVLTDSVGRQGSRTQTVSVALGSPIVVASASPNPANPGQLVSFGSGSTTFFPGSGPGPLPSSYVWSFGNGSGGTGQSASTTYSALGTYTVTLSVTDNTACGPPRCPAGTPGRTGVGTTTITVAAPTPPVPPTAAFTFSPAVVHAGITNVAFNGSPSSSSTVSWQWDFGDGFSTATLGVPTTTHTFSTIGAWTVTLIVTDASGGRGTTTATVTVVP